MMDFLTTIADFFGADRYSAHSICLTNDPVILTLYVWGDLTTFISYFAIGLALLLGDPVESSRRPVMKALFGSFIVLCGLSHLTKTVTIFTGIYRLDVAVVFAMAAVSAVTATMLIRDAVRG